MIKRDKSLANCNTKTDRRLFWCKNDDVYDVLGGLGTGEKRRAKRENGEDCSSRQTLRSMSETNRQDCRLDARSAPVGRGTWTCRVSSAAPILTEHRSEPEGRRRLSAGFAYFCQNKSRSAYGPRPVAQCLAVLSSPHAGMLLDRDDQIFPFENGSWGNFPINKDIPL